jgi:hypothetical protein
LDFFSLIEATLFIKIYTRRDGTTGDPVIFPSRTGTFITFFIFPLTVALISSRSFAFFCIIDDGLCCVLKTTNFFFQEGAPGV